MAGWRAVASGVPNGITRIDARPSPWWAKLQWATLQVAAGLSLSGRCFGSSAMSDCIA